MAKCNVRYIPVQPTPPTKEITLTLNREEASVLKQILTKIGGSPDGPRGTVDAINSALITAGIAEADYLTEVVPHPFLADDNYFRIDKKPRTEPVGKGLV